MKTIWTALALVAALTMGATTAGQAQDLTEDENAAALEFMMNNTQFLFYHEVGHMFVAEFGLPVLGKEEDAADNLATWLLLNSEDEYASQVLIDSADGWYLSVEEDGQDDPTDDSMYFGEHSLDLQRSYAVVCLMVGNDPEGYAETAVEYELPEDRVQACHWTYEQVNSSWSGLLEPFLVNDEQESAQISVVYEDTEDYADVKALLEENGFLETVADMVMSEYAIPREITFVAKECGQPNAFYSANDAQATVCYELPGFYYDVYLRDVLGYGAEEATEDE